MINFIKYSKLYFIIAIIFIVGSIFSLCYFGLNLGMDFEGGTSVKVEFEGDRPNIEDIKSNLEVENYQLQLLGDSGILLKIQEKDISAEDFNKLLENIEKSGTISDSQFETISPLVGSELKQKTIIVAVVALLFMLAYIAFAFKQITRPISSFQYGIVSTLMLFHDILIPLGAAALMGHLWGMQLTIPVVTALLAVIGYSINNSVVVFDRIRENLQRNPNEKYADVVNDSLNKIFMRCIQTSLTTLFVLFALLYFFQGEESLKYFTLTAIIGIIAGTYSSIFLASPILVAWANKKKK